MRGTRLHLVAATVLLAGLIGGCGDDGTDSAEVAAGVSATPGGGAAVAVPAVDYVTGVCRSLGEFSKGVEASQATINKDLAAISSVKEGKAVLSEFARVLAAAAGRMLSDIEAAGTPDVTDGTKVAAAALAAFGGVEKGISALPSKIEAIDGKLSKFKAESTKIVTAAATAIFEVSAGFAELDTPELREFADTVPACAEL